MAETELHICGLHELDQLYECGPSKDRGSARIWTRGQLAMSAQFRCSTAYVSTIRAVPVQVRRSISVNSCCPPDDFSNLAEIATMSARPALPTSSLPQSSNTAPQLPPPQCLAKTRTFPSSPSTHVPRRSEISEAFEELTAGAVSGTVFTGAAKCTSVTHLAHQPCRRNTVSH